MRWLIIFVLCYTTLIWMPLSANAWEKADGQAKVIKVAGDKNFPPFEYLSSSGVYTGFNIDMMNAISVETGIQIEYYPMAWSEALLALREGRVDIVQGMKYSERRDEIYDFSESYFTSSQGIFVLKENVSIHQLEDLENRKVVLQQGDIAYDAIKNLKQANIQFRENQEQAIQLLLDRATDAFIGNRITGQYFLQKMGRQDEVKIVGEPIEPTKYAMVTMPGNQDLLDMLNKGIKQIKKNGTYQKIEKKWFGEYIQPYNNTKHLQSIIRLFQYSILFILIISVAILWWNRILKKEVMRRTAVITEMNHLLQVKMKELQESDQFKQQLLDQAYSSFVTLDQDGLIRLFNRHAMEMLKWEDDMKGKRATDTVLTEFIPVEQLKKTITQGESFFHQESVWQSERTIFMNYHIAPMVSTDGKITGVIISFMDITKQKKMLERIQREDRLRSLGKMVSVVAHEIRNPLMSILTYTNLLPKKFDSAPFREVFVKQVPAEIERLNQVVHTLTDFARPKKAQPMRIPIVSLVESILFLFQQKLEEKGIEFHLQVDQNVTIYADLGQMKQILINLVMNAMDATPAGKSIWIRACFEDNQAVMEIEDEGIGISTEEIDQIFDPFYSTKPEGVGLGLSICYQLVIENKGTMGVHSSPGKGTIFKLVMPREEVLGV